MAQSTNLADIRTGDFNSKIAIISSRVFARMTWICKNDWFLRSPVVTTEYNCEKIGIHWKNIVRFLYGQISVLLYRLDLFYFSCVDESWHFNVLSKMKAIPIYDDVINNMYFLNVLQDLQDVDRQKVNNLCLVYFYLFIQGRQKKKKRKLIFADERRSTVDEIIHATRNHFSARVMV